MKKRSAVIAVLIALAPGITLKSQAETNVPDSSGKRIRSIQAELKMSEVDLINRKSDFEVIIKDLLNKANLSSEERIHIEGQITGKMNDLIHSAQRLGSIHQELKATETP